MLFRSAGGCKDVVTEHMVREHDPVEDVLFRQACHLGHMADLDSVTRDDGAVRAYCSPGHDGFRLIAHRVDHTPPGLVGRDGASYNRKQSWTAAGLRLIVMRTVFEARF